MLAEGSTSMTRAKAFLTNQSGCDVRVAPLGPKGAALRGSDWSETLAPPKVISNGERILIGSIGQPGVLETQHWGWLYFEVVKPNGAP